MPRNARVVAPGLPYHITQRGTNRERVFFTAGDRVLYLQLIRENMEQAGVQVLAYCLMTNHVHFVVVPEREDSLSVLFGRANGRYAQAVNIRKGRCGHLWQARYHSCAMSETHFWVGLRYVEMNPCRAAMVKSAQEYRWSSAKAHMTNEGDGSRILDMDFWAMAGGTETWVNSTGERSQRSRRGSCASAHIPGDRLGREEAFVAEMEDRFQRRWRRSGGKEAARFAISAKV